MKLPRFLPKPKKPEIFLLRRVTGDSMQPALKPGKVIIAFKAWRIRPGDVVIIRHNGLEKTKRVKYAKNGKIYLLGDNAAHSTDSRTFGWLDRRAVVAKVAWPLSLSKSQEGL